MAAGRVVVPAARRGTRTPFPPAALSGPRRPPLRPPPLAATSRAPGPSGRKQGYIRARAAPSAPPPLPTGPGPPSTGGRAAVSDSRGQPPALTDNRAPTGQRNPCRGTGRFAPRGRGSFEPSPDGPKRAPTIGPGAGRCAGARRRRVWADGRAFSVAAGVSGAAPRQTKKAAPPPQGGAPTGHRRTLHFRGGRARPAFPCPASAALSRGRHSPCRHPSGATAR